MCVLCLNVHVFWFAFILIDLILFHFDVMI